MYRFFIILTFSLFAYTSNAQTYVPFPTGADTAVWFEMIDNREVPDIYYNLITYGDTIFDGLIYTKIYFGNNNNYPVAYYAAIREANKVIYLRDYIYDTNLNSDTILFDFNAQVGDTIIWYDESGFLEAVKSIDSVQINGVYRKQFNLNNGINIIEGIGGSNGFISLYPGPAANKNTYCYFLNGNFIWSFYGGSAMSCYTSTTQLNSNSKITVNPNPTSDNLNIEFENTEQRELIIFNQLGQMVLNETSSETTVVLSLEQLPKGFYVLTIRTQKGVFTKKIIKN